MQIRNLFVAIACFGGHRFCLRPMRFTANNVVGHVPGTTAVTGTPKQPSVGKAAATQCYQCRVRYCRLQVGQRSGRENNPCLAACILALVDVL